MLAVGRVGLFVPVIDANHIASQNGQSIEFVGIISDDPDPRIGYVNYEVTAQSSGGKTMRGKVLVRARLYPRLAYGDVIRVGCRLEEPTAERTDSPFRYDRYLARYEIYSVCFSPRFIQKISGDSGNVLFALLLQVKHSLADRIDLLWQEPEASLMAGLLYGARGGFPTDINDSFNRTGLTHIIAVSGYNITILGSVCMTLALALGLYRRQALIMSLVCIVIFILLTGASASVVRAGVMGALVIVARYIGRPTQIGNILALTATVMAFMNPLQLLWDAGFQLSFLSTLGLVYLSLPITQFLARFRLIRRISQYQIGETIMEILYTTFAAIVATLPLVLYQFGRLSLIAPLANIMVLWIIPFLMAIGFAAVLMSVIFFPLGQLVAAIGFLGLWYVLTIIRWLGSFSFSAVNIPLPWVGMIIGYGCLIILVVKSAQGGLSAGSR